ncbi:MAG: maleylpyruvate isomerase family mycothiol-dependent enzyme [Microthrixaceae bacterium]
MDPAAVREAFDRAADAFVSVVATITPDEWARPATDAWTVRELVAHTSRAFLTVEQYLAAPTGNPGPASTAEYFTAALDLPGIHGDVAARGRDQVAALGDEPSATVTELAGRVVALVRERSDDAPVGTFLGDMTLVDYLPSRVVELVVHTLDLTDALGRPPTLGGAAARVALAALAETAALRPGLVDPAALVRALTGRAPWRGDCNVLG